MKALRILGISIIILMVVIAILGLVAPGEYSLERKVEINAPAAVIFPHVQYWGNWGPWSPWLEKDPDMKVTIEGNDGETGAIYKWVGDPDITGQGDMTAEGLTPQREFKFRLHFIKPFETSSNGFLRLTETDGKTSVVWGMYGKDPFPINVLMLFMDLESMVGPDFERGLALLKGIAEKEAEPLMKFPVTQLDLPEKRYAGIRSEVDIGNIQSFFESSYPAIITALTEAGSTMNGAPAGLYYTWDEEHGKTDMAAVIPTGGTVEGDRVSMITLPAAMVCVVDYYGDYSGSGQGHEALELYVKMNGLTMIPPAIEEYITDPGSEPDSSKWLTKIYYRVM